LPEVKLLMNVHKESKIDRYVVKPALVGGVAYGMSTAVLPRVMDEAWNKTLNFSPGGIVSKITGMESVSVPVAVGLATMLGSMLAEWTHEAVK
jgi:hypothetical protein